MALTDNEIIKAMEDWLKNFDGKVVDFMAISSAIDLITRQKAEIERLQGEMANISAKTLKRFEKNIKDVKVTLGQTWEIQNAIKETLKEMVGDV